MKLKRMTAALAMSAVLATGFSPAVVSADVLSEIVNEEKSTQAELDKLEGKVNAVLDEVNTLNKQITDLENEISKSKETIASTEEDISVKEEELSLLMDQAKERLQTIQINEVNQNLIYTLLDSTSLSDVFNRLQLVRTLFSASNGKIDDAEEARTELLALKEELTVEKESLENNKMLATEKKETFDNEVASLNKLINENQEQLAVLSERRQTEETRIAEEAAAQKAEAARKAKVAEEEIQRAELAEAAEMKKEKAADTPKLQKVASKRVVNEAPVDAAEPKTEAKPSSTGREVTVVASAYSTNQPSLGSLTATGINLQSNPNVIAVDPNVIPLGSLVEVPGHGIRIAGDTGGAIKGNRIDIHISNLSTARAFGYQTMTVKVLN